MPILFTKIQFHDHPAANPIPVNSFLKKPISHTSSGYSLA